MNISLTQGSTVLKGGNLFYIILLLFILVGGALAGLSLFNTSEVSFSLFGLFTFTPPLGLLLLCAFFLGVVVLYIISIASAWQDRREVKQLKKQVQELQSATTASRAPSGPLPGVAPFLPMPGMSSTAPLPSVQPPSQPE